MFGGLITIAGGILAASGFIIKKSPDAQKHIDKLTPYQGWIGTLMFFWGIWETLHAVLGMSLLASHAVVWVLWLLSGLADLLVGFLLGFGLITTYTMAKNPAALARGQQLRSKLVGIQAPLGALAIVMGMLYIAAPFIL